METSDWISLGAAVLSAIALAVSLYEAISNRPKLRVNASHAVVGGLDGRYISVDLVNYGRQPTTIKHIYATAADLKGTLALLPIGRVGGQVPYLLEVGRSVTFLIRCDLALQDVFDTGLAGTLSDFMKRKGAKLRIRDAWYRKPHVARFS